jgi:predicted transcriptional regulator
MAKINDTNYFTVFAWMQTELNLKGAERDVFAIIYGLTQDGESEFYGSLDYLAQLTGYSKNAVCTALKHLVDKQLIAKNEQVVNSVKYCRYRTSYLYSIQATCIQNDESVQVTCMNNKDKLISKDISNIENKIENKDIEWFLDKYNEICVSFPKVKSITEKRKKAIRKILKSYSDDDIIEMFTNAESSDFLKGKNDRGWKANIDFMLREDKFVNILEGQYNGKKYKQNVSRDIEHLYGGIAPRAKKGGDRSDKY